MIRDGFQTTRDVRAIGMDQHYQPRIVLQPVGNTTVEIVASASSAMDPTDVKVAINYSADRISELPMGRTPDAMARVSPGVTTGVNGRTQVRGAMTSGNLYLLDGQAIADNTYKTNMTHLVEDSFEETQVMTGAISAEYGNVDGGVVNTITKSGGNAFSGQVKFELANNAWNAVRARTTAAQRNAISNVMNQYKTYSLGGFIIKDRLWFFASLYSTETSTFAQIPSDASGNTNDGGAGSGYTQEVNRDYMQLKLTWRINDDHSLIAAYTDNAVDVKNSGSYGPGNTDALTDQIEESGIWNVSLRSVWSPVLNTEVRFGGKKQMINAGPSRPYKAGDFQDTSMIIDYDYGLLYNIGVFSNIPGNRDNTTANLKASYYADWHGGHEIDAGFDYYRGVRDGVNGQTVSGFAFEVMDYDHATKTGVPYVMWDWDPGANPNVSANQTQYGFYINDKWRVNKNLALQVGARFDTYTADATDVGGTIANASSFSPRLGATYDLFGDQSLIFKASYCSYTSGVMENISGAISGAGSIPEIKWHYSGPKIDEPVGYDVIMDKGLYRTLGYMDNPTFNVIINPDIKSPTCDEIQLGAAYSFSTDDWGKGFVSLTYVSKNWKNLLDYSIGNNSPNTVDFDLGLGPDGEPIVETAYTKYWDNEPLAERKYSGLELAADYAFGKLHVFGNITWSTLEGNYEGEGDSQPGLGEGINNFRVFDMGGAPTVLYDHRLNSPYGYLRGHRPLVMNWLADYTTENSFGRLVVGFAYRLNSGAPYSYTRTRNSSALGLTPELGGVLADDTTYGPYWVQYMDNQRTHGKYNTSVYHDLAVTQDFNLFKVADTQVRAYVKVQILNVFNHTQLLTWANPRFRAVLDYNDKDAPWTENPNLSATQRRGAVASGNYGDPRSFRITAGVRF